MEEPPGSGLSEYHLISGTTQTLPIERDNTLQTE